MIFGLTIAGASKLLRANSLNIAAHANGRATASFELLSDDRSYRPAKDAEVIMTEDGTRILGGLVDITRERGFFKGTHPGIVTSVNVVDFNAYAERRYFNGTLAAGTLKSQLETLDDLLTVFGVSLHASQVNGPTMPELSYDYKRVDEILNDLARITADAGQPFVWRIDHFKVLRMYQPSTTAAPFDLVGNDLPEVIGDIEVEDPSEYYNQIIVKVAPKTELGRQEQITGDGTQGPFTLQYTLTKLLYGHVTLNTGGGETIGIPPDAPLQWEYDAVTNSITRTVGNTTNGTIYTIYFDGVFTGTWTATDASHATNPRELVIVMDSIPSDTTGQAIADAELAKRLTGPKTIKYVTHEQGVVPGMQQTVNVSARAVNETAIITEVVTRDLFDRLERHVTAVVDDAQTNLDRGWRDVYKVWAGDKTGTGVSVTAGATGPVSSGPAPPFKAVQYNEGGVFGGEDSFTYDSATDSLVCGGGGSSITAANPRSCAILGYNCHISDP